MSEGPRQRMAQATVKLDPLDAAEPTPSNRGPRISLLDVARVVSGLFLLSAALSYLVTSDSILWGYRPWFTWPAGIGAWWRGQLLLTPAQLSLYNGTAFPALPILLAVNGTIFDVSASPHYYGRGGSYDFFAGRDATRAFVTGCFAEDLTADMRGVEEMFLPVEEGDEDAGLTAGERKIRREREAREARRKVEAAVAHWEGFFRKSNKYYEVGRVLREEGWEEREPRKELCEAARRARPSRKKEAEEDD